MKFNLKNRPAFHADKVSSEDAICKIKDLESVNKWFEGFESSLRNLKESDEGVYIVRYHGSVPKLGGQIKTIYIDVKEILGE